MTAIGDRITEVRKDLHDTDATAYRWTDAVLTRHIERAVVELSEAVPYEQIATKATTASSRTVNVTTLSNIREIVAVEYPLSNWPRTFVQFSWFGATLELETDLLPDGGNCKVYYTTDHSCATTQTFDARYNRVVATGAAAYAALELSSYAVNRVNVDPSAMERYQAQGAAWLKEFKAELARLKRRVKPRKMYAPFEPQQSQTTDWGP